MDAKLAKQPKLKFPLLKGDDGLDELLNELLGPEAAKKVMYGSDHASHIHAGSEAKHVSQMGDDDHVFELETNKEEDQKNDQGDKMETRSGGQGRKSVKSRSTMKNKDEITVYGHGSEVGGKKSPKKIKWNSTR